MAETLLPIAHSVVRASTCAEAWTLLAPDIELIIASLSTPGGDALRLVSQCRANETFRQLPILLIADDRDLPRLAKGLDLGANDYLIRPVDRNELLARTATQVRRKRLQDRLEENYRRSLELALTDELTGLYNRRYLFAHLDELIGRVNQDGISAAVLLFDIDHFKQVNDTYGHAAGDDVLRELAARTTHCVRSVDLVARRGDGAVRNLSWSCPRPISRLPRRLPSGCAPPWRVSRSRSSPTGESSRSRSASGWRLPRPAMTVTGCSAAPTMRFTLPRTAGEIV